MLGIIAAFFILVSLASTSCSGQREEAALKFKEAPEVVEVKPKKPLKINLRRTAEDKYTYEISGEDPEEIIKADRKLRKYISSNAVPE